MSEREDPVRLADGGSPELRALVRSARLDEPSPQALERLSARLAPTVAAAPAASLLAGAKVWIAIAVVGAIGVAGVAWKARAGESQPRPKAETPAAIAAADPKPDPSPSLAPSPSLTPSPSLSLSPNPSPTPSPDPSPSLSPNPDPSPTPSPNPVPSRNPSPTRSSRAVTPPQVTPDPPLTAVEVVAVEVVAPDADPPAPNVAVDPPAPPPPRPREIDLLGPAHDALRSHTPQRALELATRHAQLYPDGAMSEERQAILIEAQLQLGRRDDAQAAFDRFTARYPRSGYRSRLQRLLAAPP